MQLVPPARTRRDRCDREVEFLLDWDCRSGGDCRRVCMVEHVGEPRPRPRGALVRVLARGCRDVTPHHGVVPDAGAAVVLRVLATSRNATADQRRADRAWRAAGERRRRRRSSSGMNVGVSRPWLRVELLELDSNGVPGFGGLPYSRRGRLSNHLMRQPCNFMEQPRSPGSARPSGGFRGVICSRRGSDEVVRGARSSGLPLSAARSLAHHPARTSLRRRSRRREHLPQGSR